MADVLELADRGQQAVRIPELRVDILFLEDRLDERLAVGPVADREGRIVGIDAVGVAAKQLRGEAVEGRNPGTARATELLRSRLHLAGGLVGKGDGKNIVVRDSHAQQVGYAMGDDSGLAAAGPGKDHQRSIDVGYRLSLGRIELGQQVVESCFFHRFLSDHRGVRVTPNLFKITSFQWSGKQKPQRDRPRADSSSRTHYRHLCPGENPLVKKKSRDGHLNSLRY